MRKIGNKGKRRTYGFFPLLTYLPYLVDANTESNLRKQSILIIAPLWKGGGWCNPKEITLVIEKHLEYKTAWIMKRCLPLNPL